MSYYKENVENKVICWWSGGVTSAVACRIAIDIYGVENCSVIFIDTKNEDEDTHRFMKDCEKWYSTNITSISSDKYEEIEDVWHQNLSLNVATGAICSSELKKKVRVKFQKTNKYDYQVFGFEKDEIKRANNLKRNYITAKPIFPLLMFGLSKRECITMIEKANIEIPRMYKLGFHNNNCFKTGCVQGGIGYWKKMQVEYNDKFIKMSKLEHELTDLKGKPVTILKDQSNLAKISGDFQVFLTKHKDYPNIKCIDDMAGREVESLMECNGFCGTQTKMFN
jgi:3'-phosphoadenosine 5'-phosphosulfate sulfotransferase (PAPS reductase)/FAD synthetase